MTIERDVATGVWKLSGALGIEVANPLRDALMQCFAESGDVVVDLAEVSECDTTGLQLLVAAQRTAARQGRTFRIDRAVDGPVIKLAQTLGLAPEMLAPESGGK